MYEVYGEGVEGLAIGIADQAKKDYLKGGMFLLNAYGRKYGCDLEYILTREEVITRIYKACRGQKGAAKCLYWFKDARDFVLKDPYGMFADSSETIFKDWNHQAVKLLKEGRKNVSAPSKKI